MKPGQLAVRAPRCHVKWDLKSNGVRSLTLRVRRDRMAKLETVATPESSGGFNQGFPASLVVTMLSAFLFFLYVASAPFAIDARGYSLRLYAPVWWAVTEKPFSAVLGPYFKLCGIEFGYGDPDPPSESYE